MNRDDVCSNREYMFKIDLLENKVSYEKFILRFRFIFTQGIIAVISSLL